MYRIDIPGKGEYAFSHLVFDYNGTIAEDGRLLDCVKEAILALHTELKIHVLTADTYGNVRAQCAGLPVKVETFPKADAAFFKEEIVKSLDGEVLAFGNGFNDIQMFDAATIRIAIMDAEGVSAALIPHADILVRSTADAMQLLLKPNRLRATLRT